MDNRFESEPSLQVLRGGQTSPIEPSRELPDHLTLGDLALLEGIGQTPLLPAREPFGARIAALIGRQHALLFALCLLACWAITTLPSPFARSYAVGERARRDVLAPYALTLSDREETLRRRQEAVALVPPQYDPNPEAQAVALSNLRRLSTRLKANPRYKSVRWPLVSRASQAGVKSVYLNAQVRSDVKDDLRAAQFRARDAIANASGALGLSPREQAIALQLAQASAKVPNLVVNERETTLAKRAVERRVPEVLERIGADMPLVRAGEEITPEVASRLDALESVGVPFDWRASGAHALLCLFLLTASAASIAQFSPRLLARPAALWLAAVVPIAFVLGFRFLLRVPHADLVLAPVAATAAMLLTVLIDVRVGLVAGTLVAALCSMLARAEVGLFLTASLSGWVGALSVAEITRAGSLVRAGALMAMVNAGLSTALGLMRGLTPDELVSASVWGALSGASAVGATTVFALLLERPFGLTTHLRLLELLAPDEAVMKRMQAEAPGTYTHSLMVATLSEAAAKRVGADPLLCRVAGLYHDIGKLRRPHCFIENQSGDNIHDRLSPQLSALVILAHVKDGLQLGRALKLPDPVLEIVAQHHGTSLVAFFYHRAQEAARDSGRAIDEASFRYPGPRPQSKEAALVMLADSVEASARALPEPSPERVRAHIADQIAARLREGELSECELTLRDLSLVEDEFSRVLRGALHNRISYPDASTTRSESPPRSKRATRSSDAAHARAWISQVRLRRAPSPQSDGTSSQNSQESREDASRDVSSR